METKISHSQLHFSPPDLHDLVDVLTIVHTPYTVLGLVALVAVLAGSGGSVVYWDCFYRLLRRCYLLGIESCVSSHVLVIKR